MSNLMKPTLLGLTTLAALLLPIIGVLASDATPASTPIAFLGMPGGGSGAMPPGPMPAPTPPAPSGPTCGPAQVAAMQPSCECTSAEEAYRAVASVIQMNIMQLGTLDATLSSQLAELDAAQQELVHAGDNFEIQIVGQCATAALEAATVAKSITALRAACAEGAFLVQCKVVGLTTKEILQYVAKTEALQNSVITVARQTAVIVAKAKLNEPTGWTRYIPLVGSVCHAYNYSNRVFTAPDLLAELESQKDNVRSMRNQIRALINAEQSKLAAAAAERDLKCGRN